MLAAFYQSRTPTAGNCLHCPVLSAHLHHLSPLRTIPANKLLLRTKLFRRDLTAYITGALSNKIRLLTLSPSGAGFGLGPVVRGEGGRSIYAFLNKFLLWRLPLLVLNYQSLTLFVDKLTIITLTATFISSKYLHLPTSSDWLASLMPIVKFW